MHTGRSAGRFTHAVLAMLMLSAAPGYSGAQSHDSHAAGAESQPHKPTREEGALVSAVRDATDRFKKVTSIDGPGEGFELMFANRFGLDPFYTLHVWAWKENPNGAFVNWNPDVSCEAFNPPDTPGQ